MKLKDIMIIIVGSGISGVSAAVRLIKAGKSVLVL
jgi:phytoene dehydrogenase-like protein